MPESTLVRVVIVDPHPLFGEALRACLSKGRHMVVGQARNSQEALQQTDSPCPDLIIVGPHLAESGLSVCREISRRLPTLKILLFTAHTDNPLFLADAANAGIAACLPPETTEEECLAMIAKVMAH